MSTYAQLKKSKQELFAKLTNEIEKTNNSGKTNGDDRYWKPTMDKEKNAYAVIRFLPPTNGEEVPFVKYFSHAFKGPTGSWYIENCLTSLGKEDPVCEYNRELWNSGSDLNKKIASAQKRKLNFVSNVYIIRDPEHPENEGKVFLYRYGVTVYNMIQDLLKPNPLEDEKPCNAFNLDDGANFKLRIFQGEGGFPNFSKSKFDSPTPLLSSDKERESVWNQTYSLKDEVAPNKFLSYDELQKKFNRVMNIGGSNYSTPREEAPSHKSKQMESIPFDMDDDDEDAEFLRNLANKDD